MIWNWAINSGAHVNCIFRCIQLIKVVQKQGVKVKYEREKLAGSGD